MASGRTRWIAASARDVEDAVRQIREVEVLRAIAADEAAAAVGLDPNPSLNALVAAADEPWTLHPHRAPRRVHGAQRRDHQGRRRPTAA